MVKDKQRRTTRLVLSLTVMLVIGVAVAIAITTRSRAPGPSAHTTAPPAMSTGPSHSTAPSTATMPATATTPVPTVSTPAQAKPQPQPLGVGGHWKLVFNDGFSGSVLNRQKWNAHDGWSNQNGVTDSLSNVHLQNGHAILTLASAYSGAELGTKTFALRTGEFAEARIKFAGRGRTIYNWPAWWLSGPDWPQGGESDIAEGFGELTANYHSPAATINSGPIAGAWANRFHIFGIYRSRYFARIYWDGKVVGAYNTHDDGAPETMLLTLGAGNEIRTGPAGEMVVDFVRAWKRAGRS